MFNFYPTIFYIYNPIYGLDNKFYLFAYADDETIVYDAVGKELERYPLIYHEQTRWDGTKVQDRRWKKTGTAKPVLDLSGYPFAEMTRIHNGVVYFLYPTGKNHRQALYQVKIEPD